MSAAIDIYVNAALNGQSVTAGTYGGILAPGTGTAGTFTKKLANKVQQCGSSVFRAVEVWSKGSESDGTIYRIFKALPGNLIPINIFICCSAINGLSSVKIGLLKTGQIIPGGPISTGVTATGSDAVFATGLDISAGAVNFKSGTAFNGMTAVQDTAAHTLAACLTRLFEFAGDTIKNRGPAFMYDLAMTCTTAGTNTGTIGVVMDYMMG